MFDFAQEMGDLKLALKEVSVTQQISFLVLICDAKTWSLKKRNKTVSDTGLSLCTDWVFDFLQEMGDLKLTLKGVGVTQQISSLVLICDATTWSPNKRNKTVSDTGLSVGARICIIIFCYCRSFIVSCQMFIFSSSLVSFVSYQFYTYIFFAYLDLLFARNLFG